MKKEEYEIIFERLISFTYNQITPLNSVLVQNPIAPRLVTKSPHFFQP
jgi:hypothetical protein